MSIIKNPVQVFIRNLIRLVVFVPLWLIFGLGSFTRAWGGSNINQLLIGGVITIFLFYLANIIAGMFFILPQWERLVLLRLGRSVGTRGPGLFIIPPFIYSVARILDIRIQTYEVKATKTLTMDNIPIDVTAAIELEVENPEKAAIAVQDYWKTTEWASMEALKSTIGSNDLRPLLSETERIASDLKKIIDTAASDFGINVRAVRITDVGTPPSLVEELAVIARAERSAKAKQIQADAEVNVANSLAEASKILSGGEGSMELRQIQAMLDMSKEESAMVIVYPVDSFTGKGIASAAAGTQTQGIGKKKTLG